MKPKGTFQRILELSAEYPALAPSQVAQLLQMEEPTVKSIMGSDAFKDRRARLVLEKHGDKLLGIRGKIFDTSFSVLEAIQARLDKSPDAVSDALLLKLAEFFLPYAAKKIQDDNPPPPGQGGNMINITIGADALDAAKRRVEERGRTIDLPPSTRPQAITQKRD